MLSTLFTPYTVFLLQVLAAVAGTLLIVKLAPQFVGKQQGMYAVVVGGLLTMTLLIQIWGSAGKVEVTARSLAVSEGGPGGFARCIADGQRSGDIPFIFWLKQRIPPNDSFAVSGRDLSQVDFACLGLALRPRKPVSPSARPQWTVWVEAVPKRLLERAAAERKLPVRKRTVAAFSADKVLVREG